MTRSIAAVAGALLTGAATYFYGILSLKVAPQWRIDAGRNTMRLGRSRTSST